MHFDKDRLLNLAGLADDSPAELMTESARPIPSSDEQKLRRLVREELTRILQEREEENVQYALKHRRFVCCISKWYSRVMLQVWYMEIKEKFLHDRLRWNW